MSRRPLVFSFLVLLLLGFGGFLRFAGGGPEVAPETLGLFSSGIAVGIGLALGALALRTDTREDSGDDVGDDAGDAR